MEILDDIIKKAKKKGFDVRVRDVGFSILYNYLKNIDIAYQLIFGVGGVIEPRTYASEPKMQFLCCEIAQTTKEKEKDEPQNIARLLAENKKIQKEKDKLSFDENREGIEQQLKEIVELKNQAMNDPAGADYKTLALLQKTESELRVKLNDKFGASEKTDEQYIIVQPKFNKICPYTRRECYEMTKEWAMQAFDLIERQ